MKPNYHLIIFLVFIVLVSTLNYLVELNAYTPPIANTISSDSMTVMQQPTPSFEVVDYPITPITLEERCVDEDYQKVKIEYNIVDKIDYTSKVGDNLGFVDVIIDDEVIASESIYLKDKLYETNDNTKQGASLIIPTIALAISFFFVVLISTKLFFKQAKKKKKKKSKK